MKLLDTYFIKRFYLIMIMLGMAATAFSQQLAFPGAMGFAAHVTGGRGGTVYHVSNLDDSGPGSFRDAVSQPNRIVVFDVSGYITLVDKVGISSNITIAGQTAPGDGIAFKGRGLSFNNSNNIICRYIRIRPGGDSPQTDNALAFTNASNIIVDHVSLEFGPWNNIDATTSDWQNNPIANITVQNSIIADPINQQFGAHTESLDGTWFWYNNIFSNSHNRNPLAKINTVFINNVLYNYQAGYTTHTSGQFKHDIINNYFIFGPATTSDNTWFQVDKNQSIYYSGNLKDSLPDGILNGGKTTPFWYQGPGTILTAPWAEVSNETKILAPEDAYKVTLSNAGTLPRDQVDNLVVSQIQTLGVGPVGTGVGTAGADGSLYHSQTETGLPNNGFGNLEGDLPPSDMDGDGMPDFWEEANSLDMNADDAMTVSANGYTNIENYINWLAAPRAITLEDSVVTIDLKEYAAGFEGFSSVFSIDGFSNGAAQLLPDGHTVEFTPVSSFLGLSSFDFQISLDGKTIKSDKVVIAVYSKVKIEAPSNLTVSAESKALPLPKSFVTLKWDDNSDNETGFIVERSDDNANFNELKKVLDNVTELVDSIDLVPGSTYYYRLKAFNEKDTSFYSTAEAVNIPPIPTSPELPKDPSPEGNGSVSLSGGKITLSWNGSDNTDSYLLFFGEDINNLSEEAELNDPFYEMAGLEEAQTYYWRIDAKNNIGTTRGEVWSFTTTAPESGAIEKNALVGYWSLDESGTDPRAFDSSDYRNHGLYGADLNDPDIRVEGHKNNGVNLSSMKDSDFGIKIPDQPQLFLDKSSFTVSFWVKADPALLPTDNSTSVYLLCKGSIGTDPAIGSTGKRFNLEVKQGTVRFALDAGDEGGAGKDEISADASTLFSGEWANISIIRDSADKKMQIYINGNLAKEGNLNKSVYGTGEHSSLIFGNIGEIELTNGAFTPAPYRGDLDEIKIFNYALSQGEILNLVGAYKKGLVGQWSFDEKGNENFATDSSIYKNDGLLGVDGNNPDIRVEGHLHNAIDFSTMQDNSYGVRIPDEDQLFLDKSPFTISLWVKADPSLLPTDNSTSVYLLCKGSIGTDPGIGSTGKRFNVEVKQGTVRFALDAGDEGSAGKDEISTDASPLFSGEWAHLIVQRDSMDQKMRIYINGELAKEGAVNKSKYGTGEHAALILGNIGEIELNNNAFTPAPYKGQMDEVKIFNYALDYQEILTLFYGSALPQKTFDPNYNNTIVDGYEDTLRLRWNGGINTDTFKIYMGPSPDQLNLIDSISAEKTTFDLLNAPSQTQYYWRVDATGTLGVNKGDVWEFKTGMPKGLVAHYALDESSGTIAIDSSEYHNDGTFRDMPDAVWIEGKFGNALGFGSPGNTGAIVVKDEPQIRFDNSSFTISFWVSVPDYNTTSGTYNTYLFHKGTFENVAEGTGKWYGVQIKDKNLTFAIDDGINKSDATVSVAPGSNFDIFGKGWMHIVALRSTDINRIRLYINGVLAKSVDDSKVTGTIGKVSDLLIGNSMENNAFADSLDDIRIYNYAISEYDINKLYQGIPLLSKPSDPVPANNFEGAGPEEVMLGWKDRSQQADSFRVFVGLNPDSLQQLELINSDMTALIDSLTPSTKYFWRVEALNSKERAMGDIWSFTTGEDTTKPTAVAQDLTLDLEASGTVSITPEEVDNGSHDVYGIDSLWLDKYEFDCLNVGENRIILGVRDSNGNIAFDTAAITITGVIPLTPVLEPLNSVICRGDWVKLSTTLDDEGAANFEWLLNGVKLTDNNGQNWYPAGRSGEYSLVTISEQSCRSDTSLPVRVEISADTTLEVSDNVEINRGEPVELNANGSDGAVSWSPDIDIDNLVGNSVIVHPTQTTQYVATLTNMEGCKVSKSIRVKVNEQSDFTYNNILTPNGDGINDWLKIQNLEGYPNNRIQIFNNRGNLVFEKNGYANDWGGIANGKTLNDGTYYFVLFIEGKIRLKGSVTIIH